MQIPTFERSLVVPVNMGFIVCWMPDGAPFPEADAPKMREVIGRMDATEQAINEGTIDADNIDEYAKEHVAGYGWFQDHPSRCTRYLDGEYVRCRFPIPGAGGSECDGDGFLGYAVADLHPEVLHHVQEALEHIAQLSPGREGSMGRGLAAMMFTMLMERARSNKHAIIWYMKSHDDEPVPEDLKDGLLHEDGLVDFCAMSRPAVES